MKPFPKALHRLSIHGDGDGDGNREGDQTEKKKKIEKKTLNAENEKSRGRLPKSVLAFEGGLHVFTDGACEPNPGPGGWAFVAIENGKPIHSEKGFESITTNNRMEMQAVIAALRWMQANNLPNASLHTDSQYCAKGANEWRHGWKRKAWTRGEALIPNADLWQAMSAILDAFPISLHWVRGHSGIVGNEQADRLAVEALKMRKAA